MASPQNLDLTATMNTGSIAIEDAGKTSANPQLELTECHLRKEQIEGFFAYVADAGFIAEADGRIIDANQAACAILGYTREQFLEMRLWDFIVSVSDQEILHTIRKTKCGTPVAVQRPCRRANGEQMFMDLRLSRCPLGGRDLVIISARDVTERMRAEGFIAGQKRLLEMVARGEPLHSILDALCCLIEEMANGTLCSILLLDDSGSRLRHGAAPSLPSRYTKAIDAAMIGPCSGSCGTAVHRRETVIVSDIEHDPLWREYRHLALPHGLLACWSTPIFSTAREVLGSFAIYSRKPGGPTSEQRAIMEQISHVASVAIERTQVEERLRRSEAYLAEAQKLSLTGSFGWRVATGEIVWSDETYRIMGFDRTVKPTLDLALKRVHPQDADMTRQTLDSATRAGTNLDFEHRLLMPGGTVKHVHVVARPVNEPGGLEFLGAIMDVSRREKAEEALRASERLACGQVETLTRTLDVLSMESDADRLVEHVLRTIAEQLGAHSTSVWLKDESRDLMVFQFALEGGKLRTKHDAALAAISPASPTNSYWPWPEVFRTGKPYVLEDMREGPDVPWRPHLLAQGIITILIVPLLIAGKVAGVVGIRFTSKRTLRAEEMELAQALANQAMLAMQLTRLSAESRQAAVVAERNRMARDMHDTLAQGFTGVIVQLEAAADANSKGLAKEADDHLNRAGALARESLKEARRSVRALRPQALEEKDVCEALEDLLHNMTQGTSLRAEFILQGHPRPRPADWDENILRIGQEVLTNTLRHAHASEFKALLAFDHNAIRLELRDNGCGFDPGGKNDGFGLLGMRERVEQMGGSLVIQSALGKGVALYIVLPLPGPIPSMAA